MEWYAEVNTIYNSDWDEVLCTLEGGNVEPGICFQCGISRY